MPLQIYANPNLGPQLQLQGGAALGAGIGGGLSRIGEAYGQLQEKQKKESQEATSLRKLAELRGWADKDSVNTMSLADLRGLHMAKTDEEISEHRRVQDAHIRAQTALNEYQLGNQQRAPQFLAELAKYGQDMGAPYSPEVIEKYGSPLGLQQYAQAAADTGYNPDSSDSAALKAIASFAPRPSFAIPAGHVMGNITVNDNGGVSQTFVPGETEAPSEPWILSDDIEEFKAGLRAVTDPKLRKAAIESRNKYEQALGRPGLLERLLLGDANLAPPKADKPKPAQYKKGTEVIQDGVRYIFDGKEWIEK